MKIKLYSQTGKPVNIENAKAFEEEFKNQYDVLWTKKEKGDISLDDMKIELDKLDKHLSSKYPMHVLVDMPNGGKKWKNLVLYYGFPITIAVTQETKELALFLMDATY